MHAQLHTKARDRWYQQLKNPAPPLPTVIVIAAVVTLCFNILHLIVRDGLAGWIIHRVADFSDHILSTYVIWCLLEWLGQ